ncbi:hypothetical protein BGZ94_004161 [Podila epigama]|nr:hypothetical protein BGZ94_004161 [Podila epigama]
MQQCTNMKIKLVIQIQQCVQRFQARGTLVLAMARSSACLQALEQQVLDKIGPGLGLDPSTGSSSRFYSTAPSVTPTITSAAAPTISIVQFTATTGTTGALDPLVLPRIAPCFSTQDAVLYIQRLLETYQHASVGQQTTMMNISKQERHADITSTWLHQALYCQQGPLLSMLECEKLEKEFITLQNIGLGTCNEIRDVCQISTCSARRLSEFFETDLPL